MAILFVFHVDICVCVHIDSIAIEYFKGAKVNYLQISSVFSVVGDTTDFPFKKNK